MLANTTSRSAEKERGIHYTPQELGRYLAEQMIRHLPNVTVLKVLDPAVGEGNLLRAFWENARDYFDEMQLIGIEQDSSALQTARTALSEIPNIKLIHGDFFENVVLSPQRQLISEKASAIEMNSIDTIIANPPYIRTQVLGSAKAQELAAKLGLKGRVDMYHAFFVAMTRILKPGGILGAITSNRYFSTLAGQTIRQLIATNFQPLEFVDLGDTKLFDAAVLPAIFIGRKSSNQTNSKCTFLRIYESSSTPREFRDLDSIYEILREKASGNFKVNSTFYNCVVGSAVISKTKEPWAFNSESELRWIKKVNDSCKLLLKDIAKVRVGIKTTADAVFIRGDWASMEDGCPEESLLFPLLRSSSALRWKAIEENKRVLYPHTFENGKRSSVDLSLYPRASAYLESHRERLEGRKYVIEAGRNWYEIWVPQDPRLWKQPKIVFPDISPEPRFFLDQSGAIVDGNCYWIVTKQGTDFDYYYFLIGIFNSDLMTRYHDLVFQNKLYSGRRRYITQYVKKYPIPDINAKESQRIIQNSKDLVNEDLTPNQTQRLESEINHLVSLVYGVEPISS